MAASIVSSGPVGYYVHHHGTGHMRRAITICEQIRRPVIMFSSQPLPAGLPSHVSYVQLLSDVVEGYQQPANSLFHYTPHDAIVFQRNQQLIDAWQKCAITNLYVDVSIEVAVLAKLYGLHVGYALMPGVRTDKAHNYGFAAVDYLLAHYAPAFDEPANHTASTPIFYTGGIARFKKRWLGPDSDWTTTGQMPNRVTVTTSPKSEQDMTSAILLSAAAYPKTIWQIIGQTIPTKLSNVVSYGVIQNVESIYEQSDIIVGAGGTNTIMEVASIAKPFICIPELRPFDEQLVSAKTLERLEAAVYLPTFPKPDAWPTVIQKIAQLNLEALSNLVDDTAATRAAHIIESAGQL
jgi:predicted glycosyltransferase